MKKIYKNSIVKIIVFPLDVITESGEPEKDDEQFWTKFY
jgi:hypothetical protein